MLPFPMEQLIDGSRHLDGDKPLNTNKVRQANAHGSPS